VRKSFFLSDGKKEDKYTIYMPVSGERTEESAGFQALPWGGDEAAGFTCHGVIFMVKKRGMIFGI